MKRLGELRTKTIVAFAAFLILAFIVFGVSKRFEFFIFVANLLGFESDEAPPGVGIVGVDLTSGTLKYFTGEKWREIPLDKDFRIAGYLIKPSVVKKSFRDFYEETVRKPTNLKINANGWRYWNVLSVGTDDENIWGDVVIVDNKKKGYEGFGSINLLLNAVDNKIIQNLGLPFNIKFSDSFLSSKYSDSIPKVTVWRDQILEGNSCEKFLPLELFVETPEISVSPPGTAVPKKFTVRKIDNYIFVDLEKPVSEGTVQKWDKTDCFKVDEYKEVDTTGWVNDAEVQFSYYEYDDGYNFGEGWEKVWWIPKDGWVYESHATNGKDMLITKQEFSDNYLKHNIPQIVMSSLRTNSFYDGLVSLAKSGGVFELQDIKFDKSDSGVFIAGSPNFVNIDFVKGKEWGDWKNPDQIINQFVYTVLDKYNEYLKASYYFKKSDSNGVQRLFVSNSNLYTGVYLKDGFLYYAVPLNPNENSNPAWTGTYIIGSVENEIISISPVPSFDELLVSYPALNTNGYTTMRDALDYLKGKSIKDIQQEGIQ